MKKLLFSLLFLLLLPGVGWGQIWGEQNYNAVEKMTDDMILPHEGYPHGVPGDWGFATHASVSNMFPPDGITAMVPWGVVYEEKNGSQSINARVQVRNIKTYFLYKNNMKWKEIPNAWEICGAAYPEPESGGDGVEIDLRPESSGGVSIKMIPNKFFHFMNCGRFEVTQEVVAVYVTAEARLIVDDWKKPNDLYRAKYVMAVGGDWWRDCCCPYTVDGENNPGIAFARFKYLQGYWRNFSMSSVGLEQ